MSRWGFVTTRKREDRAVPLKTVRIAGAILLGTIGTAMAQERIKISSEWGSVTAELVDNAASKALLGMLPLTIAMTDHLRQEKTESLPAGLPAAARQRAFRNGTIGLGGPVHFVVTIAMVKSLSPALSSSAK